MADPIPGTGVYTYYYTMSDEDYQAVYNYNPNLVNDFHQFEGLGDTWYAEKNSLAEEYAALIDLGIEFGEAWFTPSTEPNAIYPS